MNHYVHVYRTNIDGLITDRVDDQPRTVGVSNYIQVDAIINLGYFKKDPSPVAAGQRHFLC